LSALGGKLGGADDTISQSCRVNAPQDGDASFNNSGPFDWHISLKSFPGYNALSNLTWRSEPVDRQMVLTVETRNN